MGGLSERTESIPDYSIIKGSDMLTPVLSRCGPGSLGALTDWRIVLPLEVKMNILTLAVKEKERAQEDNGMVVDERNRFNDAIAIQ